MSEEIELDFEELIGELRELVGRVVALEIRDAETNLLASAEGELGNLNGARGEWSFRLGGAEPHEIEGTRFEQASWTDVVVDVDRVLEIRNIATGIGPTVLLRIRLTDGTSVTLWPAMPPSQQWTDAHFDNR